MALTRASQEAIWLWRLLEELGYTQTKPMLLKGDNQGSLALAKNPGDHPRSKHIQLRYHFIRFNLAEGTIELAYIPTHQMAADGMTKSLAYLKHDTFIKMIGMKPRASGSVQINEVMGS